MKSFKTSWNELGLYYIPSSNGYVSYFLKRSWGNYLFFPHPEVDKLYPFIIGSGGIYKVFDFQLPFPYYNKVLFDKFGSPTIGTPKSYHEDFLIEQYPEEYFDINLEIIKGVFRLKLKNDIFIFRDLEMNSEESVGNLLERFY